MLIGVIGNLSKNINEISGYSSSKNSSVCSGET